MKRSNIEEKYKWDLSKFYSSDKDWFNDFEKLKKYPAMLAEFKGKLKNPKKLEEFLKIEEECGLLAERLFLYVYCNLDVDLTSDKYNEMNNQFNSVNTQLSTSTSFYSPELLSYNEKYLKRLINDKKFSNYALSFKELLRTKAHVLSAPEEAIISEVGSFSGGFRSIFSKLVDSNFKFNSIKDSKGKIYPLNRSKYSLYMESQDRALRKNAFAEYYKPYIDYSDTITENFINKLKASWFYSKTGKFNSVLESSLYYGNISEKLYKNLIDNINKYLPLNHKYAEIRKTYLGFKDYTSYDLSFPLVKVKFKYSFEESMNLIKSALSVLGEKYAELLDRSVNERWMDVFANDNKRSGAYQTSAYGFTPVVLLNFEGSNDSVSTIAHELGHAMHSYFSDSNQPYPLAGYTIFLAEIASTVNETLLLKYLYNNAKSDKERIYYLETYIQMFRGTIFTQTMFSEFEEFAHELVRDNKPISKKILSDFYFGLAAKYTGKSVKMHKNVAYQWSYIPHFYRPFYVYKYATGLISAICLASKILHGTPGAKEKYFEFLKSGGSDYSTEILKRAGVDLETDEPYEIAFAELDWALKELSLLLKNEKKEGK